MEKTLVENKKVGSATKTTYNFQKSNKTQMTQHEVQTLLTGMENILNKKGGHYKILIRGLGPRGQRTLKGYDTDLNDFYENEEDYYMGTVKDPQKFMKFYNLNITVLYQPKAN